jgi:hypothetical protein
MTVNIFGLGLTGQNKERRVYGMSTQPKTEIVKLLNLSHTYRTKDPTCIG